MVRLLTALLSVLVLLLPLLGVGTADGDACSYDDDLGQASDASPCLTPECVATAARVREFIDPAVDPCDNFYAFACGGWMKYQVLPPYEEEMRAYEDVDKMIASVRNLLSVEPTPSDLRSVKEAKNLFVSCMNFEENDDGVRNQAIVDFINQEFGGWPLTFAEWDESQFDLEYFVKQAFRYGVSSLFKFGVETLFREDDDGGESSYHNLMIGTPSFSLPDEGWYELDENSVLYDAYLTKLWQLAFTFPVESGERAWDDIQELLVMEKTLARFAKDAKSIVDNVEDISMMLKDVQDQYGDILDWGNFIVNIMESTDVGVMNVTDEEWIVNEVPSYFENLTSYLQTVPKRTVANYIIWRVIDTIENVLVSVDDKIDLFYKEAVYGKSSKPPAAETCVEYVSKTFELVVHRLLYADKFPEEEIRMIRRMMKEIQQEFDNMLSDIDWLDEQSKSVVKEKNEAVVTTFVYFDRAMNDTYLDNYYKNMTFDRNDFFGNLLVERQETVKKNLRLLPKPVLPKDDSLPYHQAAFNAFYENTIKFSAAMFEPPFFSRHIPQSLNYGAMGATLGHELMHAFDNNGYEFDKEGRRGTWWTEEAAKNFEQRHECMIEQYNNYYVEQAEMYINGNQTLGENIADNSGLKEAFRAYRHYICSQGKEEPLLPSLNYTQNQLFFINFAHSYCTVLSDERAKWLIEEDEHSPDEFRIIGSLQNSKDFANVFKCPLGSHMNPEKKCEIW